MRLPPPLGLLWVLLLYSHEMLLVCVPPAESWSLTWPRMGCW
jgi:hypothetical protein